MQSFLQDAQTRVKITDSCSIHFLFSSSPSTEVGGSTKKSKRKIIFSNMHTKVISFRHTTRTTVKSVLHSSAKSDTESPFTHTHTLLCTQCELHTIKNQIKSRCVYGKGILNELLNGTNFVYCKAHLLIQGLI